MYQYLGVLAHHDKDLVRLQGTCKTRGITLKAMILELHLFLTKNFK